MKAADFHYERPDTLSDALALLSQDGADVQALAGGQSLMPMMNFRLAQPDTLVDLNALAELRGIREISDTIEIGAMTRYAELETSDLVKQHIPLLNLALPHIAHSAIRNRGTIGGSAALADPAAEMPALLIALKATITVVSKSGERSIAADGFFLGLYETALDDGELIKSVSVPKAKPENRFGFHELTRRHGDYAMAGVAIAAQTSERMSGVRVVFFSVSDRPVHAVAVGDALERKTNSDETAIEAACEAINQLDFQGDLNADAATKAHLSKVVFKRALRSMSS